jgi:acyl-CoA thioesterase-1
LLVAALVLGMTAVAATQAMGSGLPKCERFAADSAARAGHVTGSGERVVVIGDSWAAGLGLARPSGSWPSRLDGRVHVAGFSGSGFSAHASPCGRVSFADRAAAAVEADADLVVVEGGLNDWDHSDTEIRAGFARLVRVLRASDVGEVVVVGPASAPSRAARVPHVDALLADLSQRYGVGYVSTADLELSYLADELHLTASGHRAFGEAVATRIAALR